MPRMIIVPVERVHLDPRDSQNCQYAKIQSSNRNLQIVNCRVCRRNVQELSILGRKGAELDN